MRARVHVRACNDFSHIQAPSAAAITDAFAEANRYAQVVDRLQKLLDTERKNVREAKAGHMRLATGRTEMEGMLRDVVDEVCS